MGNSGVGGVRTLVQTSNSAAFYTLSFLLVFDAKPVENHPLYTQPYLEFKTASRPCSLYIYFIGASGAGAVNQGSRETSWLPALQGLRVTYCDSVTQPRRSYLRRLKSMKYEIYELYPSARRAYNSIRLAVKTKSTPICKELNCFK